MQVPKISVVMSTYCRNRPEGACSNLLKRALDSILNQKFQEFELILIDDGSTDGSKDVCREYAEKDKRIKYFRFEENSGIPAKRYNDGILLSCADYITFMFDDDKWYSNALHDLYEAITGEYKDCGMVYSLINYMNVKTGKPLALNFGDEWKWEKIDKYNFLCNNSVIVKRDVINKVGGYDEEPLMKRLCDWDLWWRIGREYKVGRLLKVIGEVYAFHEDSIGVTVDMDFGAIKNHQLSDRTVRLEGELKKKLKFTFVHHGHDAALQRWRIWYLCDALIHEGHECKIKHMNEGDFEKECISSDVIVFYRCYFKKDFFLEKLCSLGKLVIYDIDDFVFQRNGRFNSIQEMELIKSYFEKVNCFTASTPMLLNQMPNNGNPKFVRRNSINKKTFEFLSSPMNFKVKKRAFRIGWLTGINRNEMHKFMKDFMRILNIRIPKVEFYYFGKMDKFYREINKLRNVDIHRLNYVPTGNWKDFYKNVKLANLDVVINPLEENDIFFSCKSELKLIETGAMGIPLITSRVYPYTELITEGVNGYFASSVEEFVQKILKVRSNIVAKEDVKRNAKKFIEENYIVENQINDYVKNCLYAILNNEGKPLYSSNSVHYIKDLIQENTSFVTSEILKKVTHKFRSTIAGLCRIEYYCSTFNRQLNSIYKIILKNMENETVVFNRTYNAKDFKHNSWIGFEFKPLIDSKNTLYELTFDPVKVNSGEGIQFYKNALPNSRVGEFFIGGVKEEGAFAIRSYGSSNIVSLPVKKKPVVEEYKSSVSKVTIGKKEEDKIFKVLFKMRGTVSDLLWLTPFVRWFKENRKSEIIVATNQKQVFFNNPYVDKCINYDENVANIGMKFCFDDVFFSNPLEHPIEILIKKIVGYHEFKKEIEIYPTGNDETHVENLMGLSGLKENDFIVFHEGNISKNKTWPAEKWLRLEAMCVAQGIKVAVVGHGSDFKPKMTKIVNFVNKLNLQQSSYLISKSKFIVTIDSDYMVLAGASDKAIVGLFFSTKGQLKFPNRKNNIAWNCYTINTNLDCYGCWHYVSKPKLYHGCSKKTFQCMNTISPTQVFDRILKLWKH